MGKVILGGALVGLGAVLARVLATLHPEALALALGMLLGILAGMPMALLVLAGQRQQRAERPPYDQLRGNLGVNYPYNPYYASQAYESPIGEISALRLAQGRKWKQIGESEVLLEEE